MQADYDDMRFCDSCKVYVRYLQSPEHAYCVECGGLVKIFSREDRKVFAGPRKWRDSLSIRGDEREDREDWATEDPRLIS